MSKKSERQFSIVYMRVCHAENLIHKISNSDPELHKLREIDELLLEARQNIRLLKKRASKNAGTARLR
jgi:hypothetical protein